MQKHANRLILLGREASSKMEHFLNTQFVELKNSYVLVYINDLIMFRSLHYTCQSPISLCVSHTFYFRLIYI